MFTNAGPRWSGAIGLVEGWGPRLELVGDGSHRGVGDRKMHCSFYPDHDKLNPQLQYLGTGAQLHIILSTVGLLWILSVRKTHIFPIQRQDFNALRKLTIDHQAVIRLRESGRRICLEGTQTRKECELKSLAGPVHPCERPVFQPSC